MKDSDSRERCQISQTLFSCATCDCVDKKDGRCPFMRGDEFQVKFAKDIRKHVERQLLARLEKQGRLKK